MKLSLSDIVSDFADAPKAVDGMHPQGASRTRTHRPGIGPSTEADAVNRALHQHRAVYGIVSINYHGGWHRTCWAFDAQESYGTGLFRTANRVSPGKGG